MDSTVTDTHAAVNADKHEAAGHDAFSDDDEWADDDFRSVQLVGPPRPSTKKVPEKTLRARQQKRRRTDSQKAKSAGDKKPKPLTKGRPRSSSKPPKNTTVGKYLLKDDEDVEFVDRYEETDHSLANSASVWKDIAKLKEEGAALLGVLKDSAAEGGGPRVFAPIRRITKNGDRAILLSQILFWFGVGDRDGKIRARIKKKGKLWVAKFAKDWEQELGIPKQQVYRHFERLAEEDGFIETITAKFSGQNCLHVRPNFAAIMEAICKSDEEEE